MYPEIMPVMLQVRNLPDDVHAKLKQRAKDERMSLSDYVARELTELVATKSNREILEWAAQRNDKVWTSEDVVSAIREGREEHDRKFDPE